VILSPETDMRSSTVLRSLAITAVLLMTASPTRAQSVTDHPRVVEALNVVELWLSADLE
jgi:hypothetical protein